MINALLERKLKDLGISISSVLLPNESVDLKKWAVVACDQYTSEPEYWAKAGDIVSDSPSTLELIFPEVYLEFEPEEKKTERISNINSKMKAYINEGIFNEYKDTAILIKRKFGTGKTRNGLVISIDLERYDYGKGSQSLIRATEGTIIDRLPPRIRVRENAELELPHIMLLIDDPGKTVIEPLIESVGTLAEAYSTELMMGGGHIKGWRINSEKAIETLCNALSGLSDPDKFKEKYNLPDNHEVLMFAVGDGNHSLATAKACWEKLKDSLSPEEQLNHPARYALVEVVNLHDPGLIFEPIHRILFNVNPENFMDEFCRFYNQKECNAYIAHEIPPESDKSHVVEFVHETGKGYLVVENPVQNLDVATLQSFMDEYLKKHTSTYIDYVHGEDVTKRIGSMKGNMGFFLSAMDKNELFKTVILDGALPRKTFSMGEAAEKRFYLEARKIK